MEPKSMVDDDRPITNAVSIARDPDGEDVFCYTVGKAGVTKIVAYPEAGHMASIPWIAVYHDDEICSRFPAMSAEILYG